MGKKKNSTTINSQNETQINEQKEVKKKSKFWRAVEKTIYMNTGEFSITRIFMVITFFAAVFLGAIGVIVYLKYEKTLPDNIYTYISTLTGGGIVQYGLTKIVGEFKERRQPSQNSAQSSV